MKDKKSNNNSSRHMLLWGVAGAYLLYLGVDLLRSYFGGQTSSQRDVLLCTVGGGAFVLIGVVLLALTLRQGLRTIRQQAEDYARVEAEDQARLEDGGDGEDPQA